MTLRAFLGAAVNLSSNNASVFLVLAYRPGSNQNKSSVAHQADKSGGDNAAILDDATGDRDLQNDRDLLNAYYDLEIVCAWYSHCPLSKFSQWTMIIFGGFSYSN